MTASKKIRNILVGWLGALAIRLIGPTLRIRVRDDSGFLLRHDSPTPVIFAFWHNRMFLMPYLYGRYMPVRRAACLVSASQDGEMIARVLTRFGLESVRGSSSRRGTEAFRKLAEQLKKGWDVAITPDGPRGPRYEIHAGVVGLASLSGCEVIPVSYRLGWKIGLPTWDGFMIPLPFSTCLFHLGNRMGLPESIEEEELEEARLKLQESLKGMDKT